MLVIVTSPIIQFVWGNFFYKNKGFPVYWNITWSHGKFLIKKMLPKIDSIMGDGKLSMLLTVCGLSSILQTVCSGKREPVY